MNQAVARGFLKLRGLVADFVDNGQAAVEAVQMHHYDLVLMDMEMPVMDGLAACRAIRQLAAPACTVPVVALTANAIGAAKDRCQEAGMDDFITKPIMRADLERVLDIYLDPGRLAARATAA